MKPLAQNSMIQNRYLIVQPIGKGGMGEVYLAIDQRLGSAVAIKRTFFNQDETLGSAFEREAKILGRLRHPVLPKVIDHFGEGGDQFLVMEHISGEDLAKRLETAKKPFPLSWVMFWADQMLDALHYLHSHEPPIVHRDIKPQNLKLTDENHIVLLDFGLSKDFTSDKNSLNSASVAGYSPHFASMEQIRGTGTDARSDLYSLAATLYQLLANDAPVDALSRADALIGGQKDPIVPLHEINSEVPVAVSDVLLKGVAIRQDERYATAAEMQKELRRAFNKASGLGELRAEKPALVGDATIRLDAPYTTDPAAAEAPTRMPSMPQITEAPQSTPVENEPAEASTKIATFPGPHAVAEEPQVQELQPAPSVVTPEEPADAVDAVEPQKADSEEDHLKTVETDHESEILPAPETRAYAAAASSTPAVAVAAPVTRTDVAAPVGTMPVARENNKSKTGLIVGLLVGILVIGGVAGAGGWYAYNKTSAAAEPTPAPTVAPIVAPTAEPAEASLTANEPPQPIASPAQEEGVANTNSSSVTAPGQPRSTPQAVAKGAPTKPTAPAGTTPPKKKPKDDRTLIDQ